MIEALQEPGGLAASFNVALAALFGFGMGALSLWVGGLQQRRRQQADLDRLEERAATLQAKLDEAQHDVAIGRARAADAASLERQLREAQDALSALRAEHAAFQATARERELSNDKKAAEFTKLRGEMSRDFETLAINALKSSQSTFLNLANETFLKHRTGTEGDSSQRQEAMQALIKPMEETLKRYETSLLEIERSRKEAYGSLANELKNVAEAQALVRTEAAKLVNAFKAAPKTRGRWGEHQLQNIMELAGMSEHVDFVTQVGVVGEAGRLIPDAIIRLPGGRAIVVDAKTSMNAYLDAIEADNDEDRERLLNQHAQQIRTHMKQLGAKSYWDALDVTPDFVAMFIPGDNFFAAAMERDPLLFEDAIGQKVILVTPTTMIGLVKSVAYGWRQEKLADNARMVADLGRDLYRRLASMGRHVLKTGKNLEGAVRSYNDMVGSLETNVMPQARKFRDLEVAGGNEPLPTLQPVDVEPREPVRGRDLELPTPQPSAKLFSDPIVVAQRNIS